jgi:Tfp pilus assembly protein FimT
MVALAVPNFERLQREWALFGGAHLLESSLQWGRMHAVASNSSMELQVDQGGRRFFWADPSTGERLDGTVRWLNYGVRIVGQPRRSLRYHPRGNAAPAGTYILQGDSGFFRVIVNPAGRIRVQRD